MVKLKKNLYIFAVLFSLLFNIQAGFTHDVEHINHESHASLDCKDCILKDNLVKSSDFSNPFSFDFSNHTNLNSNYLVNNNIVYTFVAYQSRAP